MEYKKTHKIWTNWIWLNEFQLPKNTQKQPRSLIALAFFFSRCDVTIYLFFLLFSFPFSVHSKIGGKKCSYNAILVTAHSFMNIVFAFANHRRFVVGRFFFDASTFSTQWVLSLTLYFRNDAHFFSSFAMEILTSSVSLQ